MVKPVAETHLRTSRPGPITKVPVQPCDTEATVRSTAHPQYYTGKHSYQNSLKQSKDSTHQQCLVARLFASMCSQCAISFSAESDLPCVRGKLAALPSRLCKSHPTTTEAFWISSASREVPCRAKPFFVLEKFLFEKHVIHRNPCGEVKISTADHDLEKGDVRKRKPLPA